MPNQLEPDFWDQLVRNTSPAPRNTNERLILALDGLLPNPSSATARDRARRRVFSSPVESQAPVPVTPAGPFHHTATVTEPASLRSRHAQRRQWMAIAAALLLFLSGIGIWTGASDHPLAVWPGHQPDEAIQAVSGNVPMRGADTGRTNAVPGPGVLDSPTPIWTSSISGAAISTPIVVDGLVYIGVGQTSPESPGTIVALRASDGSTVWTYETRHGVTTGLISDNGVLYAIDAQGVVYALDALSGDQRWSLDLGNDAPFRLTWHPAPLIADGYLIVSSGSVLEVAAEAGTLFIARPAADWIEGEPHLYAISPEDGSVVWDVPGLPGGDSGGVVALSADDGSVLWSHPGLPAYLGPSIADGLVVYGESAPTALVALDAASGEQRWRTEIEPGNLWDGVYSPSIAGDRIVVGLTSGDAVVLDLSTGSEHFRVHLFSFFKDAYFGTSGVAVAGDEAIARGYGSLSAFSLRDGSVLWHIAPDLAYSVPPALPVISNQVFFLAAEPDTGSTVTLTAFTDSRGSSP